MRVVLCDDHHLLVEAMAHALRVSGITVEATAATPGEAVRAVRRLDPDVLMIDLSFPDGSGLDAAREVATCSPRTKVLMLTGSDSPDDCRAAVAAGVTGYLRKGQRIGDTIAALRRVAAGEIAVDPEVLGCRVRPSSRRAGSPIDDLTPREQHVLRLLTRGSGTGEMARSLCVSPSTVRTHVQSIFVKLGVHSRLQAVALLTREGLLEELDSRRGAAR